MSAVLRVVLDQVVSPTDADLAMASRELARALVASTPSGCEVAAIVSSGADVAGTVEGAVPGLASLARMPLARRELAASWQLGVAPGVGGGMIHSPTLLAPLVLAPAGEPARWLGSGFMLALGRWSYGIFIWHVAVLAVVFGLFGIVPFTGHTAVVWIITAILSIGISAASYAFIEEPSRNWLRSREARRRGATPAARSQRKTVSRHDSGTAETSAEKTVLATATNAGS